MLSDRTHADFLSSGATTQTSASDSLSRRHFTKGVAVLAAAFATPALAAQATTEAANELGEKPEDLAATEWGEVQVRYQNLLRVYGTRLNQEQRRVLGNVLIQNERMLSSIRSFVTHNNDPAALTLRLIGTQTLP